MHNATKRRRTENTPRSNRLFGRNQVSRIENYLFIFIARDCIPQPKLCVPHYV